VIACLKDLKQDDGAIFGGKAASLGEMMRAGFPVPPGYALSVEEYQLFLSFNGFPFGTGEYLERSDEIRKFLLGAAVPPEMKRSLSRVFDELIDLSPSRLLAVRSSAVCEDGESQSMAGVFESYIDVASREGLFHAVRSCYASLFQDRALAHLARNDIPCECMKMGVVIQAFIAGTPSGVMFTADSVEIDPRVIVVNAVLGICADFVHGGKPASIFRIEKETGRLLQSIVHDGAPTLDARVLGMLRQAGVQIEEHFRRCQDIEWTIRDGRVSILQSRPITTFQDSCFPIEWKSDTDASFTWTLDSRLPLTPLQQEIELTSEEWGNRGADVAGSPQFYSWFMFQNGYKYRRPKEMLDGEKKRRDIFEKVVEMFKEGRNIFQDFVLVRLEQYREKLDAHVRTASNPSEIARFVEDALEYLCQNKYLHWQAILGRIMVDHWTPNFEDTFKDYCEKKLGPISVEDYFDLVFQQSRFALRRQAFFNMAGRVESTPELAALFRDHPFDELLYPKLSRSEEGRILLEEIQRYIAEHGLISIDPSSDSAFPPLLRDRPSVVVGWIRSLLGQELTVFDDSLKKTLRNKERLTAEILSHLSENEKPGFLRGLSLAEKAFLVSDDHAFHIECMQYSYLNIAIKTAGRWLSTHGLLEKAGDVFFLHMEEMNAMLQGVSPIPRDEIERRKYVFRKQRMMKLPEFLGTPSRPPEKRGDMGLKPEEVLKGVSGLKKGRGGRRACRKATASPSRKNASWSSRTATPASSRRTFPSSPVSCMTADPPSIIRESSRGKWTSPPSTIPGMRQKG
jgi:hypothetical protein